MAFDGPLVVLTDDLSSVVEQWVESYRITHPLDKNSDSGRFGSKRFFSAIEYIALYSGLSVVSVGIVLHKRSKFTTLATADSILTAIDKQYCLVDGSVPVIPNPRLTQEQWIKMMDKRGCISDD